MSENQKMLIINYEKCVGCGFCETACSIQHGNLITPLNSMISLVRLKKVGMNIPVVCQQCLNPLCVDACPTGALSRDIKTGAIVVDSDLCVGCKMCIIACPLGGITLSLESKCAVKCDLCGGDPLCAKVCGYEAVSYVTLDELTVAMRKEAIKKLGEVMEKVVF